MHASQVAELTTQLEAVWEKATDGDVLVSSFKAIPVLQIKRPERSPRRAVVGAAGAAAHQQEDPQNLAWTVGRMRCHHALGDWQTLCELARETWPSPQLSADAASRAEVATLAAGAAWNLRNWCDASLEPNRCWAAPGDPS